LSSSHVINELEGEKQAIVNVIGIAQSNMEGAEWQTKSFAKRKKLFRFQKEGEFLKKFGPYPCGACVIFNR